MKTLPHSLKTSTARADSILTAVMPVFGRFGFKKTSVEDLAKAAGLSKQGLYLHFAGKEEIFLAAMHHYLDEGLLLVEQALDQAAVPLTERLVSAMDAWFGRHLTTFTPESFDVIEFGDQLSAEAIDRYKTAFRTLIATALMQSSQFTAHHAVSAEELSKVLFIFGLTWKEGRRSRAEFMADIRLCVRACLPAPASKPVTQTAPSAPKTPHTGK